MKRDQPPRKRSVVSSSRPIPRPEVPVGGPLRQLKELLHSLYLEAGTPPLDDIVKWVEAQDAVGRVPSVPSRDTIAACIGSPELPAKQSDAITIAATLASHGRRDFDDAKDQARQLWAAAYRWAPLGRPIVELDDPFALEVHRAIDAAPGHIGLSVLPRYLEREHDRELRERVHGAAGGRSTMVVLVGGSSTGKTRACWEAIHQLPTGWRLWHPFDPTRPDAVLDTLEQVGPGTVVWLNETQHYLLTSPHELGERVAAGLRALLGDPRRGPVLVLGTIWPEYWDTLTRDPTVGAADSHAQARALLSGTDIGVPDAFAPLALTALRAVADTDPRLAQAQTHAQDGQITQFLAGVPALLERYRNAPPAAKALIEAGLNHPGAGPDSIRAVIGEIGLDMTVFGRHQRLCSWAKVSPRTVQSGRKKGRAKTGKGNPYLKAALAQIATGAAKTNTFLGERYRRLIKRMPKAKALVALQRSILTIIFHLLADPTAEFTDLGPDFYTRRLDHARRTNHLTRQLQALGYHVQLTPTKTA